MPRVQAFLGLLGLSFLWIGTVWGQAGTFARVSYVEGEAKVLRGDTGEWDYLDPNYLIAEGDLLTTELDARVELELNRGVWLYLDMGSELEVIRLGRQAGRFEAAFYLQKGTVRARTPREYRLTLSIETPAALVEVEGQSDVKVKSRPSGYTEVFAYEGRARVRTDEGRMGLAEGEWIEIDPYGEIVERGRWEREEDFDRWYRRRIREVVIVEYIPVGIEIGLWELSYYGSWTYVAGYGWVWVPPVTSARWRPYYYGRWVYRVGIGWVWVSFEPWGWVPYHYGRWAYVAGIGWVWIPGRVFAPAWVRWCWGPDWIAWAPLGPGDVVITTVFVDGFYLGAYTVVTRESFFHPRVRYKRPPIGGGSGLRPVYVVKENIRPKEWRREPLPEPEKVTMRPIPQRGVERGLSHPPPAIGTKPTPRIEREKFASPQKGKRKTHIDWELSAGQRLRHPPRTRMDMEPLEREERPRPKLRVQPERARIDQPARREEPPTASRISPARRSSKSKRPGAKIEPERNPSRPPRKAVDHEKKRTRKPPIRRAIR